MLPMASLRKSRELKAYEHSGNSEKHAKLRATFKVYTATVNATLLNIAFMLEKTKNKQQVLESNKNIYGEMLSIHLHSISDKKLFKPFNLRVSFSALESSLVLEWSKKHVTVDWPLDCSLVDTCLSVKAKKKNYKRQIHNDANLRCV